MQHSFVVVYAALFRFRLSALGFTVSLAMPDSSDYSRIESLLNVEIFESRPRIPAC
jgi:hypothetical protein